MEKLKFPVKSFKKFDDPYDSKKDPAKFQFFMNINDVPSTLQKWLKVNPREQKMSTDVARDIGKSLADDKMNFHLLNRGMLISAEAVSYDNRERVATITLKDSEKHGIVDGGHTFRQILKFQEDRSSSIDKYVQVEIITKVSDIEELAEARNNSVAVDDKSIEELKGSFNEIKDIISTQVIGDNLYFERISFRQNEFWGNKDVTNVIDVREIVAIINMFNPELYNPNNAPHPIQSYTGKEASLNKFLKLSPKGAKNKESDREYRDTVIRNMSDIIPDIFSLWDTIETEFTQVSKDLNKRYGTKPYSNYNNLKIKKVSLFSNKELSYTIPKGIMYPVLGAFRALVSVDKNTGKCYWEIDPFKVWEERRESMVSTVLDNSASFGNSPDQIGKSSLIWDSLFNPILIYRLTSRK